MKMTILVIIFIVC